MSGTSEGGRKAAELNKKLYGIDFYKRIGAKGGKAGRTGGFAANIPCSCDEFPFDHVIANCAGKKGGRISRKGMKSHKTEDMRYELMNNEGEYYG